MQMLYEQMTHAGAIEKVAVMHGKAPDIQDFLDLIAPQFSRASIRLGVLGAVIGSHGGAEILGIECLQIDGRSRLSDIRNQLRWNEAYYGGR